MVEFDYWHAEDGCDAGWHVDVEVRGWLLTKAGTRNKTVKRPERVVSDQYPPVVHEAVCAAYDAAKAQGNMPASSILGDDGRLGTSRTLL